ncbi:hypothetical protein [Roseofilum sp. Guam]|uniref:hypothetical protein n=1 Tax=Roseofilum sp. Guam TaxID=2821502 RepID=UPI001B1BE2D0|nr:hypothetical protein [Roseofilum sp. Guam]MBP0028929.1 hypothetical protein [Roseofilum sp. Guam]
MAALVAGAAKAAGDAAPDAYQGLKALIKRKFGGEPKAEMVLEEHESDPETYEGPLKKKLLEAGADQDQAIIAAAQKLLDEMESKESIPGSFQTTFEAEVKGAQVGHGNQQTNTFS